jgi:hypothetical protein
MSVLDSQFFPNDGDLLAFIIRKSCNQYQSTASEVVSVPEFEQALEELLGTFWRTAKGYHNLASHNIAIKGS